MGQMKISVQIYAFANTIHIAYLDNYGKVSKNILLFFSYLYNVRMLTLT